MTADVNWTAVLTSIAGVAGTLFAAVIGPRLALAKDRRLLKEELDRSARYLAIQVICKFNLFVGDCCNVVVDQGERDSNGEWTPQVRTPTIDLPKDVDWKSIDYLFAYRILNFPNLIQIADENIREMANIASPPGHEENFEARQVEYGQLGLTAFALVSDLRTAFNLPNDVLGSWDPKITLEGAIAKATKSREERDASAAGILRRIKGMSKP